MRRVSNPCPLSPLPSITKILHYQKSIQVWYKSGGATGVVMIPTPVISICLISPLLSIINFTITKNQSKFGALAARGGTPTLISNTCPLLPLLLLKINYMDMLLHQTFTKHFFLLQKLRNIGWADSSVPVERIFGRREQQQLVVCICPSTATVMLQCRVR